MDSTASPMANYLIIGNSVAANAAAARLHCLDPHGAITMVTDEPEPYYSRCALMYYAMDHCHKRDTYLADPVHYRRLNARLVHAKATAVDTQAQLVALEDGGELSYDRLLIASGSVGRRLDVPGESCAGLHEFITLTDATAVVESSRGARRALVVGGGLIGAEAAEVFHVLGLETAYLVREPHFYARFCSPEQGEIVRRHFQEQGLALLTERSVTAFETDLAVGQTMNIYQRWAQELSGVEDIEVSDERSISYAADRLRELLSQGYLRLAQTQVATTALWADSAGTNWATAALAASAPCHSEGVFRQDDHRQASSTPRCGSRP